MANPYPQNPTVESLRSTPASIEAEEAVIGGLLIDNNAWDKIADMVGENDFFKKEHRLFFHIIHDLARDDQPFDAITLSDRLHDKGEGSTETISYLLTLAKDTPSAANIKAYAEIVHGKAIRRKLIEKAHTIIENARSDENSNVRSLLDKSEQMVFSIAEEHAQKQQEFMPLGTAATATYKQIEDISKTGKSTGLETGYSFFDAKTSGLQKGDLIVIAGRPSMGKSSLAANIIENIGLNQLSRGDDQEEKIIALFSMEMPASQIAMRFYASMAKINQSRLRDGKLKDKDWVRLTSAMEQLQHMHVYIDDSSVLSPLDVRARSRRLMRENGSLGLIVIDYLQMMKSDERFDNRVTEISEVSRSLKALARELNVPVIALSQLNRSSELRKDKRPIMSDLRESGAIEQDADLIVFLYRDQDNEEMKDEQNIVNLHIAKQRNGPQFEMKLVFRTEFTRFESYAEEGAYGMPVTYQSGHKANEEEII